MNPWMAASRRGDARTIGVKTYQKIPLSTSKSSTRAFASSQDLPDERPKRDEPVLSTLSETLARRGLGLGV